MELALGIALKTRKDEPAGLALRGWYEHKLKPSFAGRILPVDEAIAEHGARLQVERSRPGNDVLIAATAVVHDLTLITRNVRDFTGIAELQLVDPWSLSPD
jgi:predicted nucleic acid-binding protein